MFESAENEDDKHCTKFGPKNLELLHKEDINGAGIKIAIIDSYDARKGNEGFQKNHSAFSKSTLAIENMIDEEQKSKIDYKYSEEGNPHALICAGIAVGQKFEAIRYNKKLQVNENTKYPGGIAPAANVTVYLVDHHDHKKSSLYKALEEVEKGEFHILSMSFGRKRPTADGVLVQYETYIEKIRRKNTIIVAAGGNWGNWEGISYPACRDDVISVGALDSFLLPARYSPPEVDILFYGEIMVPYPDATKKLLKFFRGTSAATPGIAGVICLILQCATKHGYNRTEFNKENVLNFLKKLMPKTKEPNYSHLQVDDLLKAYKSKDDFDKLWTPEPI